MAGNQVQNGHTQKISLKVDTLRHQHIYDLAELCVRHGIRDAVICPGSRSAPLALAFGNHPAIRTHVQPDERSAAFIALGIAKATGLPTVLICTSGSAALNFAPAVAEAYYQQIPLLVCSADRPQEWIGQRDGQTIDQSGIFGKQVKQEFHVHTDDNPDRYWIANRMMNQAIGLSVESPKGPVHLNFPFREPLYPAPEINVKYGDPRVIRTLVPVVSPDRMQIRSLKVSLSSVSKILLVAGQADPDGHLPSSLMKFLRGYPAAMIGEAVSNLHGIPEMITTADLFLGEMSAEKQAELRPDLLITWGDGIISRHIRTFLRRFPAKEHWHIQVAGPVADTFMGLTRIIRCEPAHFFKLMELKPTPKRHAFPSRWKKYEKLTRKAVRFTDGSEPEWVSAIMDRIPPDHALHLANSLSVRYANLVFGGRLNPAIKVFSNRGTSGIDGCTSTAVGYHRASGQPCVLLTGDVAFFYDRNAFWPSAPGPGFKVCLLNNSGGQIFNMIDGPKDRKEARKLFIGDQPLDARHLCSESGIHYIDGRSVNGIKEALDEFFKPRSVATVLEIFTEPDENRKTFEALKNIIRSIL